MYYVESKCTVFLGALFRSDEVLILNSQLKVHIHVLMSTSVLTSKFVKIC